MKDRIGIPLKIGDLVYDIAFHKKAYVVGYFDNDENTSEKAIYIEYIDKKFSKKIYKTAASMISLEPHKITNPELFL